MYVYGGNIPRSIGIRKSSYIFVKVVIESNGMRGGGRYGRLSRKGG